ncbi:MAG: efflux RND transporter periplasmic adaptor subunit [Acidobacteriota bacterium]
MKPRYTLPLGLLACAIAAGLAGCSSQRVDAVSNIAPAVTVEQVADPNLITVDKPERFPLATATSRAEVSELIANGSVAPDVSRTVPVNALSAGRVLEIHARLGDDVQKGQLLLTINSSDMSQAFSEYRKFQADEALAKTQSERAQLLFSHGALAQKDLDVAAEIYDKAKVDTQTALDRIRILGGAPLRPSAVIEVRAPISGTIVEQNVTAAAGVKSQDNSPNLFTIADLSQVWVICDVYENDLAQVREGDRAQIEFNAYPNRKFSGRISNIGKLLDPNTRSAKVRMELSNEHGLLRPNMFATVHFQSQGSQMRTVVPATAVMRLEDRDWVFVKAGENQFRREEVHAGAVNNDGTEQVSSGLRVGKRVVRDALLFDRESKKE